MTTRFSGGAPVCVRIGIFFEFEQVLAGRPQGEPQGGGNQYEKRGQHYFAHDLADMEKEGCAGSVESPEIFGESCAACRAGQTRNPTPPPRLHMPPFVGAQGPDQSDHGSDHHGEFEPFDGVFLEL